MNHKIVIELSRELESKFSTIEYHRIPVESLASNSDQAACITLLNDTADALDLRRQLRITVFRRSSGSYHIFGRIALESAAVASIVDMLPEAARLHANLWYEVSGTVVETSLTDLIGVDSHMAPQISSLREVSNVVDGLFRVVTERGSAWFSSWSTFDSILDAAKRREWLSFMRWNIDPVAFRAAIVLGACNGEYGSISRAMDWYLRRSIGMNSSDSRCRAKALDEYLQERFVGYRNLRAAGGDEG
ncbi:hypothetical protein [Nocardia sp. MW-W600-9]